jgi:uncharacterized protein (DUF1501 family)
MTNTSSPETGACCPEYAQMTRTGLSRRGLFRGAALAGGVAVFGSAVVTTQGRAYAASPAAAGVAGAVMVVLSLRGAADGLSLVVPHADPVYYQARPTIAVASDRLLVKDGMFGLHPALAPLVPLWNAGKLAAVHATGLASPNRSHFSAMEAVEDADPGTTARVGWLNRLIGDDSNLSPLQGLAAGSLVPASLGGPEQAMSMSSVAGVTVAGADSSLPTDPRRASLEAAWSHREGPLGNAFRSTFTAVDAFAPVRATSPTPANGAVYPAGDLGSAMASVARTVRGDVGVEVITVDQGDWDHHAGLGTPDAGRMFTNATALGKAIAAFFTDLGPLGDKVTLVTISEFGRRVTENASGGLDHGYGNVMFLAGAGVKGGRYHGTWPGLTNTSESDLLVTTDYRSVLSEVVTKRFGASSAQVFPGFTPSTVGAMT